MPQPGVLPVIEPEPRSGLVLSWTLIDQPDDRRLVPLDDDIGDLGVSKDAEDVRGGIANGRGARGVGMDGDPHHDRAARFGFVLAVSREASRLERRVLEAAGLDRRQDTRSDGVVPYGVERRVEDAVDCLGGDLEEVGSGRGNGEGVGLEVGTPHELGRVAGDAVVPEVLLILGDQVRGDDGAGV